MDSYANEVSFKLRKMKNSLPVYLTFSLIFGIGLLFSVLLYTKGQSFYYLFTFIPYLLFIIVILLCGPPYPLSESEDIFTYLNDFMLSDMDMFQQMSEFSIGCITMAPISMVTIIYITTHGSVLVLTFQIIAHCLIMTSFLFLIFVFYKPIPQEQLIELREEYDN